MIEKPGVLVVISLLALTLAMVSCAETRPSPDEWQRNWNNAVVLIPEEASLGDPPSKTACEAILVSLRASEGEVFPTPTESMDDTIQSWFELAKGAFFDCPPGGEAGSFGSVFEELKTIEAEVEVAIESQGE